MVLKQSVKIALTFMSVASKHPTVVMACSKVVMVWLATIA